MVDIIQRSSAREAEIAGLANKQLDTAQRLKKASQLRGQSSEQYRQAEIAGTKLFAPRLAAEKEIQAIDKQLSKERQAALKPKRNSLP